MTKQEQQTQHTLSKDDKTVDQVKAQSVKDFELTVVVCDHVSNSSKQMVVSFLTGLLLTTMLLLLF